MRTIIAIGLGLLIFVGSGAAGEVSKDGKDKEAKEAQTGTLTLVRDGRGEAVIVVGEKPARSALFGAQELQEHVRKITGATLPIVRAGEAADGKRIYVGESKGTRQYGLTNENFKSQEYTIKFVPDGLILMGRDKNDLVAGLAVEMRGGVSWREGKYGKGLSFSNGVVTVRGSGFKDDAGTLEAWVCLPAGGSPANGVMLRLDGNNPWSYHIVDIRTTNRVVYTVYSDKTKKTNVVSSGELGTGWHHVMAAHDVGQGKMWLAVDGVNVGESEYKEATTCAHSVLQVGGMEAGGGKVAGGLAGGMDEVRVSDVARTAGKVTGPFSSDSNTVWLIHCDEGEGIPTEVNQRDLLDGPWLSDEQATCYAVYDFLERFCGVRWYAPTELGMVYPTLPTLTVKGDDIRRKPVMDCRAPPCSWQIRGMAKWLWNHADAKELNLFLRRLKAGGQKFNCNHSFEGYYDRFWKQNSKKPEVFEGAHPEYFAQGYKDQQPPQLCYTNPDLIKQVIQDARDYFDGKGLKPGAWSVGDYFALEPMDNAEYCLCSSCKPLWSLPEKRDPPPGASSWNHFSQGYSSDYWFGFVNKVAREIKKSHPDKYIATLAYGAKTCHPGFPLESNIAVQMCFATRYWECFPHDGNHEKQIYQTWLDDSRQTGRHLYLWLYYNFPEFWEYSGWAHKRFYVFPGFFAHTAARQIKMFARDGIRGIFIETDEFYDPIDTYLTYKLMDDPSLDADAVLDEFFTRYYGSAGKPMKKLYLAIEETYSNPNYYPEMVRAQTEWGFHQTEEMAWGYLGNEKRMKKFGKLMEQAKSAAKTDIEKKRIELFEKGVWDYMVKGRKRYLDNNDPEIRKQREAYHDKIKSAPPPSVTIPAVPDSANGDPLKVDWSRAAALDKWSTIRGYPMDQKITARLAHDQKYLYLQFEETEIANPSRLVSNPQIWHGDEWEAFFSAQRGKAPYRQFAVNPDQKFVKSAYGEDSSKWKSEITVVSDCSGKNKWIVSMAFPLETLLAGGVKPGRKFYANFYRGQSPGLHENLAWSPNFEGSFHKLDRLGEFVLE